MGRQKIECKQCGRIMQESTKADSSIGLQVIGVGVFLLGICLLIVFPIGTVIGILLMIGSARLGYKKVKIWKCSYCGYFFERV